jgi:hypothetical protein
LPQVRGDALYHVTPPDFPNLFFHLFDSSGVKQRLSARHLRAHACTDLFGGEHINVGAKFVVQFTLNHLPVE